MLSGPDNRIFITLMKFYSEYLDGASGFGMKQGGKFILQGAYIFMPLQDILKYILASQWASSDVLRKHIDMKNMALASLSSSIHQHKRKTAGILNTLSEQKSKIYILKTRLSSALSYTTF